MRGLIRSNNSQVLDDLYTNYLFFDELLVIEPKHIWPPGLFQDGSPFLSNDAEKSRYDEFRWCEENAIFIDALIGFDREQVWKKVASNLEQVFGKNGLPNNPGEEILRLYFHIVERTIGESLQPSFNDRLVSVREAPAGFNARPHAVCIADAYQVSLKELKLPDAGVPWEDLIALKADRDFLARRNSLIKYCAELVAIGMRKGEISDMISDSMYDYNKYMDQVCRTRSSVFVYTCVQTAEIVEEIVKLRLSTIAERVVGHGSKKLAFLKDEQRAPGRQVSALIMANNLFSKRVPSLN